MLNLVLSKAASGDAESIRTLEMLRSIGFMQDEPKREVEEPSISEILDMCRSAKSRHCDSNWYKKSAGL